MKNEKEIEKWEGRRDFNFLSWTYGIWFGSAKVEGWKTVLFGWEEKWDDKKCSLYKFTLLLLLDLKKK